MKLKLRLILFVGGVAALASCEQPSELDKAQARVKRAEEELASVRQHGAEDAMANLDRLEAAFTRDRGQLAPEGAAACKASLAVLMGRDPRTMTATLRSKGVLKISYVRPDGDRWNYLCEATPTRVQWATFDNGSAGPWRLADQISYQRTGSILAVKMEGGETDRRTHHFKLPGLRQVN